MNIHFSQELVKRFVQLPKSMQKILVKDLETAFVNRVSVMEKAKYGRQARGN